jgi:phosphoglycerol transferase MdoB-like AlkP superfamily enzyme
LADSLLISIYIFASVSQVVLMLLAVSDALAIMRMVGRFWAWMLMITAFVFFALRDFTSLASVLTTPVAQLTAKTDVFTISSVWPGTILNELAYGTLAASTYGLVRVFRRESSKREDREPIAQTVRAGYDEQ